jgi:GNAT superfamily N-acetyltransferase
MSSNLAGPPPSAPQAVFGFPSPTRPTPRGNAGLRAKGLGLRAARSLDLGFLRGLYASLRADEMAGVPWATAAKAAFLDNQFALQHHHFTQFFPAADFLIVEAQSRPIGRLYVDWAAPDALVIDIGLMADRRGGGLGSALLAWAAAEARRRGAARLTLHVLEQNGAARRLYERLGFIYGAAEGAHIFMALPLGAGVS